MKRKQILIKSILVLSSFSMLYSCKKNNDNNTDQLASLGTATITGRVTARLVDTIGASNDQMAPTGTVINAWVDTRDFVLGTTGSSYARRYFTTTTNASGYYTLTVDVSKYQPATIHIEPSSFEANVMKKYTSGPDAGKTYYTRTIFESAIIPSMSINNNDKALKDISYN